MKAKTLTQRVARLESIEAIRALVGQYARGADRRNDPAIMRELFTKDAVWEAKGFGLARGRDAIVDHLHNIGQTQIVWSLHYMVSPIIQVADDLNHADCHWYLWELAQFSAKNIQSHWIGGWYESKLERRDEVWKFVRVSLDLRLIHHTSEDWKPLTAAEPGNNT